MAERTPRPWEVAYPWDDNSGRYQHKNMGYSPNDM